MERIEKADMEENKKYWNPIIETLPRERLMEIELKRFRETLRWAKEGSPFYRKKLHGNEPERVEMDPSMAESQKKEMKNRIREKLKIKTNLTFQVEFVKPGGLPRYSLKSARFKDMTRR